MLSRLKNSLSLRNNNIFYLIILLGTFYLVSQYFYSFSTFFSKNLTSTPLNSVQSAISVDYSTWLVEKSRKINPMFYRHATSTRNSSYPFVSGDTFRSFSDFVYDETKKDNLTQIQHGDTIFVKADLLTQFFSSTFDSIKKPFVLISHNSDFSAPGSREKYLSNPKILHWYASNPDRRDHPKVSPIPIGIANPRWSYGNIDRFFNATQRFRKPWAQRTLTLYVNFDPSTNRVQRGKALAHVANLSSDLVYRVKEKLTAAKYLEQVGNAKFVLSPPGNGLDCHRTWEALMMGAAPIVLTSPLDPLFRDAPVVILNNWNQLTDRLLKSRDFSPFDKRFVKTLTADYWFETIRRHRQSS